MIRGHIPREFLPLQAGWATSPTASCQRSVTIVYSPFSMYSVAFHDSLVDLMEKGKLVGASATSLSLTSDVLKRICSNMDFFGPRIVLRPQEVSNDTGVIRRLGVIAMNPAIEVDIYGNVNSSHIFGTDVMNGIGGSGEYTRNSYLSIIMCPSTILGARCPVLFPCLPISTAMNIRSR